MNAITTICLVLGATVLSTAIVAGILWICDWEANGCQINRKRG